MTRTLNFPPIAGTTLIRSIIPASIGSTPHVTNLDCTSDKAASLLKIHAGYASYQVQADQALGDSTLTLDTVEDLADGDVLVIHTPGVLPFVKTVNTSGVNAGTKVVTFTATLGVAVKKGARVYRTKQVAQLPVGAARKTLGPTELDGAFCVGEAGMPLVLELDGTSACRIDAAAAALG